MKQFIYKIPSSKLNNAENVQFIREDGTQFLIIDSLFGAIGNIGILINRYRFSKEFLKIFVKLVMKRNMLYAVKYNNAITSDGLISFSHCNHYNINPNDCVIGPVNTDNQYRGKGFATFGLKNAMLHLSKLANIGDIYIDTKEDNFAMQRVIAKCGFGEKYGSYERS